MAKRHENTPTETVTEAPAAEASAGDGRGKPILLPNGEKRADYIRRRYYTDGAKRGQIAKELSDLQGKKVPYQIVFAATKKKAGEPGTTEGSGEASAAE